MTSMTTHRMASLFSLTALPLAGLMWIVFVVQATWRITIFKLMIVPALILLAGYLAIRCTVCGKSAFLREALPQDTFLGWATNLRLPVPEKICARCRADLTVQPW
jgi:hypothetical protein